MSGTKLINLFRPVNCLTRSVKLAKLGSYESRTINTTASAAGIAKLPRLRHTIPEEHKQYEESTAEWSYVERVIAPQRIPNHNAKPGEITPSGWVAPSAAVGDHPYYVKRTANHMIPVYIDHQPVRSRFLTVVKKVEGDVFALGEELRQYLAEKFAPKHINLRVHEPHQTIHIKGQYLLEVKEFLIKKGF